MTTQLSLSELLQEPIPSVIERERTALDRLLKNSNGRVVLFGAGTLGKRALALLRGIGCAILAFSDNNPEVWGSQIEDIPVFSPQQASSLYGETALFLVTIWNDHHWFSETYDKLSSLGCSMISTYSPLFWRFPDAFLQLVLLNELPHKVYEAAPAVLKAEKTWADESSAHAYRANIRWRALGDARELPGRPQVNTYFPIDLFKLDKTDSFLDCGAFDGDTIRELFSCFGSYIASVHAVEADAISFRRLQRYAGSLSADVRNRICLYPCFLGAKCGMVSFESTGTLTSKPTEGGAPVECMSIDELFADAPLTFIKMDIEGGEYDALLGARKVIERDRPILAICVYHTQSDIWRIPLLVREMAPEYKLYLRAYEGDGFQTVMYAVPPNRAIQASRNAK
jgi:FkbM family methyltransferase